MTIEHNSPTELEAARAQSQQLHELLKDFPGETIVGKVEGLLANRADSSNRFQAVVRQRDEAERARAKDFHEMSLENARAKDSLLASYESRRALEKERDQLAANIVGLNASREMLKRCIEAGRKERDDLREQSTEWRNVMKHVAEMPGKDWLKGQLILATFLNPKGAGKDLLAELTAIMTSPSRSPSPCPTCVELEARCDVLEREVEKERLYANQVQARCKGMEEALKDIVACDKYGRFGKPHWVAAINNARTILATIPSPSPERSDTPYPAKEKVAARPEDTKYRVWSIEHDAWWKPNGSGYTTRLTEAGMYSFEDASRICWGANAGSSKPMEAMVPVIDLTQRPGIADTSPALPSEVHPIESRKMGEATNGRTLLPKLENAVYKYPDGSAVYKLPRTGVWVAHWADRTPLRGCEGEIETASYFNTPEDAAKALLAGGEGPASMTDSPPPASPSPVDAPREGENGGGR